MSLISLCHDEDKILSIPWSDCMSCDVPYTPLLERGGVSSETYGYSGNSEETLQQDILIEIVSCWTKIFLFWGVWVFNEK